jgi:hypothetical protein
MIKNHNNKYSKIKFIALSLITSSLIVSNMYAEEGFDDEGGFDDEIIEVVKQVPESNFDIYGFVDFSTNYNLKGDKNISSAKVSSNIKTEYRYDKNTKIKSTIKSYYDSKTDINNDYDTYDINELTLNVKIDEQSDFTFGRQIIVWGKSDNIRITDKINSLNNTTPGMVDIEDLRRGRMLSKIDFYNDNWTYSGILMHETRYSLLPEVGSDYYNKNLLSKALRKGPSNNEGNFALSASGNFEGQDIVFYLLKDYVDNTPFKSRMLGVAYNKVVDSFSLKSELAYNDNYENNYKDSMLDGMLGVEYNGISDGSLSFEIANKDNTIQYAGRYSQSFLNQTLDVSLLHSCYEKDGSGGGFTRLWSDYAIDDTMSVTTGIIAYYGGSNKMFESMKNNDRLFVSLKYNF